MRIANFSLARFPLLCLVGVFAMGPGLTAADDFKDAMQQTGSAGIEVVFTAEEIRLIRVFYQSHSGDHGKGKRKQKGLPPGIAKNLARGKQLPPGIARQVLPHELHDSLPPVRHGHERIVVDGKILLVEIATQIVRDVLTDIVFD